MIAFFTWEWWIDEKNAALPPKMWFYDNFSVLFGVGLLPYFWWISGKSTLSNYVFPRSALITRICSTFPLHTMVAGQVPLLGYQHRSQIPAPWYPSRFRCSHSLQTRRENPFEEDSHRWGGATRHGYRFLPVRGSKGQILERDFPWNGSWNCGCYDALCHR
jgi:hypothetical protein